MKAHLLLLLYFLLSEKSRRIAPTIEAKAIEGIVNLYKSLKKIIIKNPNSNTGITHIIIFIRLFSLLFVKREFRFSMMNFFQIIEQQEVFQDVLLMQVSNRQFLFDRGFG